jgi:hypothetical protein
MWVVVIALVFVAIVISWHAYRCQTNADRCNASRTAQDFASAGSDTKADAEKEKSQDEAARACADANGYLCLVLTPANLPTIYLVLLGLGAVIVGMGTLGVIEKQVQVAERDLIIASRAFLSVGEPEKAMSGEIRVPIENRGRVSAKILSVEITIIVHQFADGKPVEKYRRSIKPEIHEETIVPGDPDFSLFVHLPEVAKDPNTSQITVFGDVKYDIGFNGSGDELKFMRTFPVKYSTWIKGWAGISTDFRESENKKQ